MNEVDYIGKKSVGEVIRLSKLTKFIVFQQGATKGSTPMFRSTESKSVEKAERSFYDWADSMLRMNPNNNKAYELFLYSSRMDDLDIENDIEENEQKKSDKGTKRDKIRFSFSLNPYNNMYGGNSGMGGVNVEEAIKKGIADYELRETVRRLQEENKYLRENGNEEEEEEEESAIDKVSNLIKLVREGNFAKVAGDEEEEDDEDDIPDPGNDSHADKDKISEARKKRQAELKTALERIKVLDPQWKGLCKLGVLAKKNPTMFTNYMNTLLKMDF